MFDINTVLSAALSAAITEATNPLLERIATLESANDILHKTQHEDMVAMRDRITALETKLTEADLFTKTTEVSVGVDPKLLAEASLNYLNDQEWFWEKIQRCADAASDQSMSDHLNTYDHDSYDTVVSDSDDFVKSDDLEDTVRDAVSNLSFEVSVS